MSEKTVTAPTKSEILRSFIATALTQTKLSGIKSILQNLAEATEAYGCILWEPVRFTSTRSRNDLFAAAEWFQAAEHFETYKMPVEQSANGAAMILRQPVNVPDIDKDPRTFKSHSAVMQRKLRSMCAVPLQIGPGYRPFGSLSFYRREFRPFTEDEFILAQELTALVTPFYNALRRKVSQDIMERVANAIRAAEDHSDEVPLTQSAISKTFKKICNSISKTFNCVETSLFLADGPYEPYEYSLMATSWPEKFEFPKTRYLPNLDEGLTGWVLANKKPLQIFDLKEFTPEYDHIQGAYPDLQWNDSLHIKQHITKLLRVPEDQLPPLSFMAVPIMRGTKVLGVIRCCTRKEKGLYYFADRDLKILAPIADKIGHFWDNAVARRRSLEENRAWNKIVAGFQELNTFARDELQHTDREPHEQHLYERVLHLARDVVKGSDILDIRLYDEKTNTLKFAAINGAPWHEGTQREIRERLKREFSVSDGPECGVKIFNTGENCCIYNAALEGYHSKTFPKTHCIIIVPIRVENRVVGVLDIRGLGPDTFEPYAVNLATLLAQQIGLYCDLIRAEKTRREQERNRRTHQEKQQKAFEIVAHQLKTPSMQAHARANHLVKTHPSQIEPIRKELEAISGLCGRAKIVAWGISMYEELSREEQLNLGQRRLTRVEFALMTEILTIASQDNEVIISARRNIGFNIKADSFQVLNQYTVEADIGLLEQAVSCVLDNAGKYSFPNTKVISSGGVTSTGHFFLQVENKGFSIKADDIERLKKRGERGIDAWRVAGEGSGQGLWLIERIMNAHGGHLLIIPTTKENITRMRLLFPSKR